MILKDLIHTSELAALPAPGGITGVWISSVTCDSRTVEPGSLFVAVPGNAADGHLFIRQALERGAAAVAAQYLPKDLKDAERKRIVMVKESRRVLAMAAARFYNFPSRELTLVGITGTNGKTTITYLLESIFKACGGVPGVIGTVNIRYPGVTMDTPVTTPDPVSIQKALRQMADASVTHVAIEVSSHSLAQNRVDGCEFDACIFTNLTQDHLDYHKDLDDYFACKTKLFTDFEKADGTLPPAVINTGDPYGARLAQHLTQKVLRVNARGDADISASEVRDDITGLHFTMEAMGQRLPVAASLTGGFNLENILCAAGAALALGLPPESVTRGIRALNRVPGRLEKLPLPLNRHAFVDYAHTPDALDSILRTLSQRKPARLITVFGCGGDRDTSKRAPMGQIACKYSDIAIVTSDNPRTEAPDAIVQDIVRGIEAAGIPPLDPETLTHEDRGYLVEVDREKALNLAMKISRPNDTIVAAGKGHETYQITNSGTIHFDDAEKLTDACERLLTPIAWSVEDIELALGTRSVSPPGTRFSGIGTDSRTINPSEVFLALSGDRFDGHDFIGDLIGRGVRAFVVRSGFSPENKTTDEDVLFFEVEDTLKALGQLAAFQRRRSRTKVLAITGSNGKTTTRKMAKEIFSIDHDTLSTRGNLNNEIGMPLTLLKLSPVHEWAVVEMGMNHEGELDRLSAIAAPDMALVTNVSSAHLEGLKTADNVARAKAEIFNGIREKGTALIFADDPRKKILEAHAGSNPNISTLMTFGTCDSADFRAEDVAVTEQGIEFSFKEGQNACHMTVHTPARFMANNALAAAAAARTAGISYGTIAKGLAAFTPVKGRMNLSELSNGTGLIDDTYNANPASMSLALSTLVEVAGGGEYAFSALGDMLELGEGSAELHRRIGHQIAELDLAGIWLFGPETAHVKAGALEKGYPETRIFEGSKNDIARDLARALEKGSARIPRKPWLLLKGSRGMAMETLIAELNHYFLKEEEAF